MPRFVGFESTSYGLNDALAAITVTNDGSEPVPVGDLRVAFEVRRNQIAFPCERQSYSRELDAATLPPHGSFTGYAPLRCWTPLPGSYDAEATVGFAGGTRLMVASFGFHVVDDSKTSARPIPSRPGLYVLAGDETRVLPVPEGTSSAPGPRFAVVFVNASERPLALPPARVTLEVFRVGDALACTSQVSVHVVAPLDPGAVHVEHVPVTCLRDRIGVYWLRALVGFEANEAVEAGRVRVEVTRNVDDPVFWP
jgi:hypothetical protein